MDGPESAVELADNNDAIGTVVAVVVVKVVVEEEERAGAARADSAAVENIPEGPVGIKVS